MTRRFRNIDSNAGRVQIVEMSEGRCHVGFLPKAGADWLDESERETPLWRYWGLGEGGYDATVARFLSGPPFAPSENDQNP